MLTMEEGCEVDDGIVAVRLLMSFSSTLIQEMTVPMRGW